jgi:hypothetical protein
MAIRRTLALMTVTTGLLSGLVGVGTPVASAGSCNANVTWTAGRHSGGETPYHRAVVTAEPTTYHNHKYWGLSLAWEGFPGNSIACYVLKEVDGTTHTGSGPGGIALCSGSTCDTSHRYVRLEFKVVHNSNVNPVGTLRSDLPGTIHRSVVTTIKGHLRWHNGDPGRRSVSVEWWRQSSGGLSHVCHFKPNDTVNTTTGTQPVYLTPADGDFTAKLRPGCFPDKGDYVVAVSSLAGFPQGRSSKQLVHVAA